MPTYEIDGIPVEFPHSAYDCQIAFMDHVLKALKNSENALLESPTGTGKTLSLLCAALAWRTAEVARGQLWQSSMRRNANYDEIMDRAPAGKSGFDKITTATGSVQRLHDSLNNSLNHDSRLDDDYGGSKPPLIIYASRTHSQLAQVIKELRRTTYRPKVAVIGSREQMCIHPGVKEMTSSSAQSAVCNRLTKKKACEFHTRISEATSHLKKKCENNSKSSADNRDDTIMDLEDIMEFASLHRACPYYTSRELLEDADLVFMPYNYLLDKKTRGNNMLSFKDAIIIFDEAHNVESSCYDAVSCEITSEDLHAAEKELEHCLELVDSPFFSIGFGSDGVTKDSIVMALTFIRNVIRNLNDFAIPVSTGFLAESGDSIFRVLEEGMQQIGTDMCDLVGSFEQIVKLYLEDQYNRRNGKRSAFQSIVSALRTIYGVNDQADDKKGDDGMDDPLEELSNMTKRKDMISKSKAFYRMVINEVKAPSSYPTPKATLIKPTINGTKAPRSIAYWCFNPGVVMKDLIAMGTRSIILTSGTLSPMKSFMQEMQIDFKHVLENEHVIDDDQVYATVVGVGPTNRMLNSSFQQRDSKEYQQELGLTILNFCRVIPDGVLVFFPSYQVMESCLSFWQSCKPGNNQTIFQMIQMHKVAITEPKNKHDLSAAMEKYSRVIDDPNETRGAIFFAVCRGKVSEGLDFADAKGRGVIVTGIPYPPFKDPKIILKKQYLQDQITNSTSSSNVISGAEWYNQQASRAVNQALGRVIRHRHDFGAVLLCDERFANPGTIGQLSKWLRGRVKTGGSFGEVQGGLARFFKDKPKHVKTAGSLVNAQQIVSKPSQTFLMNVDSVQELNMQQFKIDDVFGKKQPVNTPLFSTQTTTTIPPVSGPVLNPSSSTSKKFDWFARDNNSSTSASSKPPPLTQTQTQTQATLTEEKQKRAQEYLELAKKSLSKDHFRSFMGLLKLYRAGQLPIEQLLKDLVEIIRSGANDPKIGKSLLEGFETFVPAKHKNIYEEAFRSFSLSQVGVIVTPPPVPVEDLTEDSDIIMMTSGKRKLHSDFVGKRQIEVEPLISERTHRNTMRDKVEVENHPLHSSSSNINVNVNAANRDDYDENNTCTIPESCPICKDSPVDPFRSKCNHVACYDCWTAWLGRTLECPLCRTRTRVSQLRKC